MWGQKREVKCRGGKIQGIIFIFKFKQRSYGGKMEFIWGTLDVREKSAESR